MIRTKFTVALAFAALGLNGLARASAPTSHTYRSPSLPMGVVVRAPSLSPRPRFKLADVDELPDASRIGTRSRRATGLSWTVLTIPARKWSEGQPIAVLVALGPSNPGCGGVSGARSAVDSAQPCASSIPEATGWTRPLGMRLSIRW
jgi:hypothetical protein